MILREIQFGTDPAKPVVNHQTATPAAGPPLETGGHVTSKTCRRESNPSSAVPGDRRQSTWHRQQHAQCPRQESNLVCNLRRVACDPAHSKDKRGQVHFPAVHHNKHPQQNAFTTGRNARRRRIPQFVCSVSLPGIEPGLRPSQSRVRSGTLQGHSCSTPPRSRTSSDGFEDRHASLTPAGRVEFPLLGPGATALAMDSDCRSRTRTGPTGLMKAS